MKAVVCHDGNLTVREVRPPEPGRGQILIKVLRTGICGSDLHARAHAGELSALVEEVGYKTAIRPEQEVVLGHELLGAVVSYGPRTRGRWEPGTTVTAMPMIRTDGEVHMVGFDEGAPGGYAEYTVVQEALTFPVPPGVHPDKAAFTEPLAVAWHAVRRASIRKNRPAIVIGCGPIGLAVILMLKAVGVRQIVASDLSPGRRKLAARCGADVVVDPRAESLWNSYRQPGPVKSIPDLLEFAIETTSTLRRLPFLPWEQLMLNAERLGRAPSGPVVFDCAGVPGIIGQVISEAPMRTRLVVVGMCMGTDTLRPALALQKEIDLMFAIAYDPAEFQQTLGMIASGRVDPTPLHTGTVGLDGVDRAFADLLDPEVHAKILIDPSA